MGESGASPVRVLLVDDDAMVCTGISLILSSAPDLDVVGTAGDGLEAIDEVTRLRPDVVLMDVRMPRMDGIAATEKITALADPPRVIVLTTFEEDEFVVRSIRAGAAGFLLKTTGPADIISKIRDVVAGGGALSAASARSLFALIAGQADPYDPADPPLLDRLSAREREVAEQVWMGKSNADIAATLYLSETTVKTHLAAIQAKLGVGNRVEIAVLVERFR